MTSLIPQERIERAILLFRGQKVLLDRDHAELYGVETRTLVQAVKRNRARFRGDFMFQLSKAELEDWRSQFVARRLDELEKKYDKQFAIVFDAIRQLMAPPNKPGREIGYHTLHTLIRKK